MKNKHLNITYKKLFNKFEEKGYELEFSFFIHPPPMYEDLRFSSLINWTKENRKKRRESIINKIYRPSWEYWNTWIDYQQYKF